MIHFKFTRKNVRRLCVTMALIAPIVYLFGSLFMGLNGAHGAFPYSADYEIEMGSYLEDYNQLRHNFVDGVQTSIQGTDISVSSDGITFNGNGSGGGRNSYDVVFEGRNKYVDIVAGHTYYLALTEGANMFLCVSARDSQAVVLRSDGPALYTAPNSFQAYFGFNTNSVVYTNHFVTFSFFDVTRIYPDGVPTLQELNARFSNVYYPYVSSEYHNIPVYGQPDNSQYVFNQFFAKDNWLAQIGRNAVSVSPYGFSPFGSLFRYIDENALHMAETQVGLMAYGYMYWCAHVLLFDVLFMMTTFFISFIERVGDRLGGNE